MTGVVIGIDGGGTKTRAILADEKGTAIVESTGPGSAVRPGGAEHSADVVAAVVKDALASANMSHVTPRVLCVGVAGVGDDDQRQAFWQALVSRDLAEEVVVHADAMIALDDAFGDGPGVLLIAGTGSVAFGRGPTGTVMRCGGWGPHLGDEGGGGWLGRRALSSVAAAQDGREPETALTGAVLTATQVDDVRGLVAWAASATPAELASLAPAVLRAAEGGDRRAITLVGLAVEELALHVRTLGRKLFADERAAVPVAFSGGLLVPGSFLRKKMEHRLKSAVPGAQLHSAEVDAARGAVRGALRYLGVAGGSGSS